MSKSRPPALSKTERKRDPQENTTSKSPPLPTTGTAKDTGLSAEPASSKAAEEPDSPTPQSSLAAVPAATPIPGQATAYATAPPVTGSSNAEYAEEPKHLRPPSPAASVPEPSIPTGTAVMKSEPKPDAETGPSAGAKSFPVVKRAAEYGATAESTSVIERRT